MKKLLISCLVTLFLLLVSNANALTIDQTSNLNQYLYGATSPGWNWTQNFTFNPGIVNINSASLIILANDVNTFSTVPPDGEIDEIRGDGSYLGNLVQGGSLMDSTTTFNNLSFTNLLDGSMVFNIRTPATSGLTLRSSRLIIDYSLGTEEPPNNTEAPEPMTLLLVGSGMLGLVGLKRKFKK